MAPILASREAPVEYMALKYSLDSLWVIDFLSMHHLPRLVACERRTAVANRLTLHKFIYGLYTKFCILANSRMYTCVHIIKI